MAALAPAHATPLARSIAREQKPAASVVMVDPATAQRWLTRNDKNRRVRPRVVNAYAKDMAAGRWLITGEAVKFDKTGRLIDGQHRLLAVVQSGVTVAMFIVCGLESDAQDVMDTGSKRVAGDVLTIHGRDNGNLLAAAAKWCILFDTGMLYVDRANRPVTHSDIVAYIEAHPLLDEAARLAVSLRRDVDMQPSILLTAIFITARIDAAACNEFFSRLADGIGLPAGSPILALRSRLREIKNNKSRIEAEALLSVVIRAWNAWRTGRPMATVPVYRNNVTIKCPVPA